jgi:CubicO group peptidase (beta-lactamase class C family)
MTGTDSLPEDVSVPERSIGYLRLSNELGWSRNTDTLPFRGTSAGGGYSTVSDFRAFADALSGHKLLSARSIKLMTTGKSEMWPGFKYGYGFMETVQNGVRWVGHSGEAPGMNGEFWFSSKADYVLVVLSNFDPPSATAVAQWIVPLLPR